MALPDYLQDTSKDFAKQLTAATSVPINTSTFTGRQFVAGEDGGNYPLCRNMLCGFLLFPFLFGLDIFQ